jgi:hypothetical protein
VTCGSICVDHINGKYLAFHNKVLIFDMHHWFTPPISYILQLPNNRIRDIYSLFGVFLRCNHFIAIILTAFLKELSLRLQCQNLYNTMYYIDGIRASGTHMSRCLRISGNIDPH